MDLIEQPAKQWFFEGVASRQIIQLSRHSSGDNKRFHKTHWVIAHEYDWCILWDMIQTIHTHTLKRKYQHDLG